MSIDRGLNKEEVVHTFSEILLSHKNEILPLAATWMQLEIIVLSEISQIKTNIIYHLCVDSNKNDIDKKGQIKTQLCPDQT